MFYTDNPPLDAERYYAELEQEEPQSIGKCFYCDEPILAGQEFIDCEDGFIHFDCWMDYGREKKEVAR